MKHFLRPTLTAAALAVALGFTAGVYAQTSSSAASSAPVNKIKASQVVGYDLAASLPPIVRDAVDPATVASAVQAALQGQKPPMSEAEFNSTKEAFVTQLRTKAKAQFDQAAVTNKAAGEAFLAKNKKVSGVKTTASGLQYQVITQGTGARPGPTDTVKINYVGTFVNGEVFDDSSKHQPPGAASIPLAGVIPGFREGLQLMQVGGHYKLFIPSSLGYGTQSQALPPNETLIFDVTLVGTGPTPASAQGQGQGAPSGGAPSSDQQ